MTVTPLDLGVSAVVLAWIVGITAAMTLWLARVLAHQPHESIPGLSRVSLSLRRLVIAGQDAARSAGLEIHRRWPSVPAPNVLAMAISDVLLRRVLAGGQPSDFTFIQIGANDGVTYDPIRPFVLRYGWRGVCVEPQPGAFARLVENYREYPAIACEQAAVAATDGEATMFRFRPGPHVPAWADCLSSFSPEVLRANFHHVRGEIEPFTVPTISVRTLLARHNLSAVDLVQIDTEGFDYEIIQLLDLARFRPTLLHFEPGMLTPPVRHACYQHLHRHGYTVMPNGSDAVAYLEPPEQALTDTRVWVE